MVSNNKVYVKLFIQCCHGMSCTCCLYVNSVVKIQ